MASALCPTETVETKAVVKWWADVCSSYGLPNEALLHIPNEGKRSVRVAAILKAEGMRPGTPDLFLAVPRHNSSGLWIEMKRQKGGVVSDNQRHMMGLLEGLGYEVQVCRGASEALTTIQQYLAVL